ncbi:hypothetical protein GCM10007938_42990 [Vibrio zhanjiangensis]|uniref:Uncharacterized protein n=1 Tax=Vibrio zhanjiangensis TaxID=1046128 RepID=A0ABQ6F5I0_9VIBR|nr:hypothetical protein [Vibrio zhanjiangensis]GLT20514.1 hypothetical protein GCM10007938_42990 [Vibrio zhanjiangensis]
MTTKQIKNDITETIELSIKLRDMIGKLHKNVCLEMSIKEKQDELTTEEQLLSEIIIPMISDATQLLGKVSMLDNIYNK